MRFIPALFFFSLLLTLSCDRSVQPEDPYSLVGYPPDSSLQEALLRSREVTNEETAAMEFPDSSMFKADLLAEGIDRPGTRLETVDSLFAWWGREPGTLAALDVAIWKRNKHERWDDVVVILSELGDTSSARGLYTLGRTARSSSAREDFYTRADARAQELGGGEHCLLKVRLARILNRKDRRDEALSLLLDWIDEARLQGGPAFEARFWHEIADVLRDQGRDADALHAYKRAAQLYAAAGLTERRLNSWTFFAIRLYHLEGTRRTHGLLEDIAAEARVADLPFSQMVALNRLSSLYQSLDEYERALRLDRQTVSLGVEFGDPRQVPRLYLNVADNHMKLAQMDSAWAALEEARIWVDRRPTARNAWAVTMETADFWILKGEYERADSLILIAEEIRASLPPSDEEIIFLLRRSEFGRVTGRTVLSHRALQRARELLPQTVSKMPGVDLKFDTKLENVRLDLETGQFDFARNHLDSALTDLALRPSSERATRYWNARGILDDFTGDADGALASLDSALANARRSRLPGPVCRQHLSIARFEFQTGDLDRAQARCDSVAAYLEHDLSQRIRLEHQLIQGQIASGRGDAAHAISIHRGALRSMGDKMPRDLAVRFRIELGEALAQTGENERALTAIREASRHLAAGQIETGASELRLAAAGAIEDSYLAQIRLVLDHPELADSTDPAEMTLLLRQEMLDAGYGRVRTHTLEPSKQPTLIYLLDDDRSYLWILIGEEVEHHFLPGRAAIELKARQLQSSCAAPGRKIAEDAAAKLSSWLLSPLEGRWRENETLVILPDGALHGLPWTLLPWGKKGILDHGPVVESRDLPRGEPSAPRFDRASNLLSVGYNGDGSPGSVQLAFAEEEAASIAAAWPGKVELLLGHAARGEVLTRATQSPCDVIHLSVHANMHQGVSDRAYLRFATAVPGAPSLTVQDIRALDLTSDLVFLSCCEASRNGFSRKGPIMDLAMAFTEAGARHVVASPIRVHDEASRHITPVFYGQLLGGYQPAEALRRTQLRFRDGESKWSHPYYWANYHLHQSSR